MNFTIRKYKSELTGSGYIEICPGIFSGKFWQEGCAFVEEEAFGVTEGIVLRYFPDFSHFGPNEIPIEEGLAIAEEWENAAENLEISDVGEVLKILCLIGPYGKLMKEEIKSNKKQIAKMLKELSALFNDIYAKKSWLCVLGV